MSARLAPVLDRQRGPLRQGQAARLERRLGQPGVVGLEHVQALAQGVVEGLLHHRAELAHQVGQARAQAPVPSPMAAAALGAVARALVERAQQALALLGGDHLFRNHLEDFQLLLGHRRPPVGVVRLPSNWQLSIYNLEL